MSQPEFEFLSTPPQMPSQLVDSQNAFHATEFFNDINTPDVPVTDPTGSQFSSMYSANLAKIADCNDSPPLATFQQPNVNNFECAPVKDYFFRWPEKRASLEKYLSSFPVPAGLPFEPVNIEECKAAVKDRSRFCSLSTERTESFIDSSESCLDNNEENVHPCQNGRLDIIDEEDIWLTGTEGSIVSNTTSATSFSNYKVTINPNKDKQLFTKESKRERNRIAARRLREKRKQEKLEHKALLARLESRNKELIREIAQKTEEIQQLKRLYGFVP